MNSEYPYIQEELEKMSDLQNIDEQIRAVLKDHARLNKDASALGETEDLYQAGMTSHASVNVMLGLEGAFDVEFPDHMLKRNVFTSVATIHAAVLELTGG
jgi:acyl carrier protein